MHDIIKQIEGDQSMEQNTEISNNTIKENKVDKVIKICKRKEFRIL